MCNEPREEDVESLPLPKDWAESVRHAVLNVVGIVRLAMLSGREFLISHFPFGFILAHFQASNVVDSSITPSQGRTSDDLADIS
jgi:hypothetical protein